MAFELLKGIGTTHLYRHDLESLFYVMLLTTTRHTISPAKGGVVMRAGIRPYQKWFNEQDYDALGNHKMGFLLVEEPIDLSPAFEDFRPWLTQVQNAFSHGFNYKNFRQSKQTQEQWKQKRARKLASGTTPVAAPFDDETLGGCVDYSTIIEPARDLEGELGELVIRYETSIDVIQVEG